MSPLFFIAVLVTLFSLFALLASMFLFRPSAEEQRVETVLTRQELTVIGDRVRGRQVKARAVGMASALRSRFGAAESSAFKQKLDAAGIRKRSTADLLFASQLVLPVVLGFAGSFAPSNTFFIVMCGAVVGYLAPDMWLKRQISQRKRKIRRGLPDAIDLLVICVGAGLGLDQALLRVGEELTASYPELAEELMIVNLEQRAGKPRLEAWEALAGRTKIDEFVSFSSMLSQTDRFGTPIIKSLTRYSEDLRTKRRQHAEEAAVKTKVKIIFPLVICIFPCIFIVLLAPAVLTLLHGLKDIGH